jgi:hypothetical protein
MGKMLPRYLHLNGAIESPTGISLEFPAQALGVLIDVRRESLGDA